MKINEIIMEGPFSWLANRMVGRASAKSGKKDFQKTIGALMHGWDSYVQRAGLDLKTNPAQYKQFLDMYLKKAIGFESTLQTQLASRQDVANYIQSVYQEKAKSDLLPAANNAQEPEPTAPAQPSQPVQASSPASDSTLVPKPGYILQMTIPGKKYDGTPISNYYILKSNNIWYEMPTRGDYETANQVQGDDRARLNHFASIKKYPMQYIKVKNPMAPLPTSQPPAVQQQKRRKSRR